MRSRRCFVVSFALALVLVSPALAAWTPQLPGWTAHEVPLHLGIVESNPPDAGIALDPVSGDIFAIATTWPANLWFSLVRVSQSGQVTVLVDQAPAPHPVFDPIHRVVYLDDRTGYSHAIQQYDEHGAPLPAITGPPMGPIAVGPDGDLYSVGWHAPVNTHLELLSYQHGWAQVKVLPLATLPGHEFPDQILIDSAGKLFLFYGSGAYRVDDTEIVFLGGPPLLGPAAVGEGMLFIGSSYADASGSGPQLWTPFALPGPDLPACAGAAVTPDGRVLFMSQAPDQGPCSLVIFTTAPTPAKPRTWGQVKRFGR